VKRDRISPLREIVARNVRRLRAERGWSQEELAERVDLHRTNVSKLERSLHSLSLDNLYWVADAFGVMPGDLLKP
jgi:transcriptional regulator with XRE-family HTH domain